ncbi:transglycosylase domain-containing protein [Aestuariivirga litoralis]|uniref:transglycosylase domain-containing protein n=1 Tax=Aestuariivirga litoralis TaxID=2650924 RepID=UPI0018C50EC8|nr:PBP1A family penicillin-binding protein [Aestuariivirga litoralis]
MKKKSKGRGRGRKSEPRLFEEDEEDEGDELQAPTRRKTKSPDKKRRSWFWRLIGFFLVAGFWGAVAGALAFTYIWFSLDQRGLLQIPQREPGAMILANNGSVLAEEGAFFGDAAKINELPDYVPNAVIAIEDRRFRSHYGIDPVGILRAMSRNVLSGHMVQGGSTLTQQLAKNLFLTPERTATRKAQEAVLAIWLEHKFTKDEILQLYLNRVYFGNGATGIEQAAHNFFNKSASELTVMEAARLAACLKAPSNYNPVDHMEESTARAKLVLAAMQDEGFISQQDEADAVSQPTNTVSSGAKPARQYAVDWIDAQLPQLVKDYKESIVIETTIDPAIQSNAEKSLNLRLQQNGKKLNVSQGAIVVMDNTGAVLSMVGGKSYGKSQFNRAIKAQRQPGSAFKAFVYLAAMEHGFTPESTQVDEPVKIGNWSPENYKHKYLGEVSLEQAFAQSINTVAAKLAATVGPDQVVATAQRLGITSPLGHDASIALGTSEVTPLEMTAAFVPFANGGDGVTPYVVKRITTREGQVLYERKGDGLGQVVAPAMLGEMNTLFRAVVREGTGVKAQFGNWDIGGKTGTTQDYRDAWFIGFTPYLTAGIWMGNDDNSSTKQLTGGSLPAVIWKDIMEPAHKGLAWLPLPGRQDQNQPTPDIIAMDQNGEGTQPEIINTVPNNQQDEKPKTIFDLLFGKKKQQQNQDSGLY